MKNILFVALILLSSSSFAQSSLEILCNYTFDNRIVNLMEERNPHCEANVIWGNEDVCFIGDAQDLTNYFNGGHFAKNSQSLRVTDAYVSDAGTVIYTGTDAMNFYSKKSEIAHCQ